MLRRLGSAAAVAVLAVGLVNSATYQVVASATPKERVADMVSAIARDLHLTTEQAQARLALVPRAAKMEDDLRMRLGAAFGGMWIAADQAEILVGVTDYGAEATARAAGAVPVHVTRSENALNTVKAALDHAANQAPTSTAGWYVDLPSNSVVVQAAPAAVAAAEAFARGSGGDADAIRVLATSDMPHLLYDVRGGDAFYTPRNQCSIGFSVQGGYVTAGHCGAVGLSIGGYNQVAQGTVQASTFPGNDYGWVATNGSWTPRGVVNNYAGGVVNVSGSQEAPTGSPVCRSGPTTGWRCGSIQAKNVTVRYPEGTVNGLTRTNACAEPGDSGGPFITDTQAQGVTSGGDGNCTAGGTTFFQPVNPILSAYGLKLVTEGGWSGWESLGNAFSTGPAVSSWAAGRLDAFAVGTDKAIWHRWYDNNGWSLWESLGGGLTSDPGAVSWGPGRIDVFARGTDNALWHRSYDNNGWSFWEWLGGSFIGGAAVSSWAAGRLDVFVIGPDNALWHKWYENGWSAWEPLGGALTSGPAAVSWSSGRIDIFARGTDNALWHKLYQNGWSGWESLGSTLTAGPGVSSWAAGRLDVFTSGQDNALWHRWYENGWSAWEPLGGALTSGPAAVSWSRGRIDVFARGTDNAIWHKLEVAGS